MKKIFNLLFEAEGSLVDTPEESMKMTQTELRARKALDSVDDQIDALILRYEASSIRDEDSDENLTNTKSNRRKRGQKMSKGETLSHVKSSNHQQHQQSSANNSRRR